MQYYIERSQASVQEPWKQHIWLAFTKKMCSIMSTHKWVKNGELHHLSKIWRSNPKDVNQWTPDVVYFSPITFKNLHLNVFSKTFKRKFLNVNELVLQFSFYRQFLMLSNTLWCAVCYPARENDSDLCTNLFFINVLQIRVPALWSCKISWTALSP